ncbi:MAG: putative inorganic carbon transporter subunit DabA, partial [Cephaloticoccus sp.]
ALRNMSLTRGFGRVVLVCGHGSRSANNPYASSLDCGACGGHAGDVNARLAAETANDPLVRVRLAAQGIDIPDDTWFVAGLHETTTDQVALLDLDLVPDSHRQEVARLQSALDAAAAAARRERAQRFGQAVATVDRDTTRRTVDVSEVRPEWGLANNAALIVAPRWRTAGLNLAGRTFLHDYVHEDDTSLAVLTLILTAPMVVATWINLHYYASRLDPERYGSGNKVLHNVTSGLGVVEGNAGDLRVGLPWQSIHDGRQFRHEPRRLTVFVEAPQESIDTVLGQHPEVLALVENEWLHLLAISGDTVSRRHRHGWSEFTALAHANT